MTLKEYVIANVKPEKYYSSRFNEWSPHSRELVSCPFHEDGARPNLSISLKNGGAKCHSSTCGRAFGNIVHFESTKLGIKEPLAARRLYKEFVRPIISKKTVAAFRDFLFECPDYLLKIKSQMGLSLRWVRKFSLGLDPKSHRITIPIYDNFGNCVNIRYYRLPRERNKSDSTKIYNHGKGYGRLDLFPAATSDNVERKSHQPIILCASEKEAMLARSLGWEGFSSTAGEGSWDDSWNSLIKDRIVVVVFDTDKGGRAAAKKLSGRIATNAKISVILSLPFHTRRKDWKDFADWILREHHHPREFSKLVRKALRNSRLADHDNRPVIHSRRRNRKDDRVNNSPSVNDERDYPEQPELFDDQLHDVVDISSRSELLNVRVMVNGIVAAKSPNTYSIPWQFEVKTKNRPSFTYSVPMGRELLRFVRASDGAIIESVRTLVGSNQAEVSPIKYLTANEIEIIPTAVANTDAPYVVQRCYFFGERIEANVPYAFELIPTSEIRSQETIGVITTCTPLSRSTDRFILTPETHANLSFFQPSEEEDIWAKLATVANDVAHSYTRVYNRLDWTLVALLTWCCPIGWRFPNEPELQRGWLNTLALGDTETGKSKVAKALQKLFNCGVFVSGENCTFVGLVGGAIKSGGDRLMLRWGRIPLSDKQMVVVEELSGLSVREIADMSDVRSSGVARLDKGGINSETNSRTRLLCLSNARSERRSLANHLFGVHAVHELIGHGEDIARFDLIATLTDREVSNDIINTQFATIANQGEESTLLAPDQFEQLVRWIWSLTPEQIEFTQEAYEACLSRTKKLAARYHPSIPIFKGGSGRYKLGRIAASIAAFQFSWNSDTERLIVGKAHVYAACKLLRLLYDKSSLGYSEYSRQMYSRETIKDAKEVRKVLRAAIKPTRLAKTIQTLIHATRFSKDELQAIASTPNIHADEIIGVMVREGVVRKGDANLWDITPAGKKFLEEFAEQNIQ